MTAYIVFQRETTDDQRAQYQQVAQDRFQGATYRAVLVDGLDAGA